MNEEPPKDLENYLHVKNIFLKYIWLLIILNLNITKRVFCLKLINIVLLWQLFDQSKVDVKIDQLEADKPTGTKCFDHGRIESSLKGWYM